MCLFSQDKTWIIFVPESVNIREKLHLTVTMNSQVEENSWTALSVVTSLPTGRREKQIQEGFRLSRHVEGGVREDQVFSCGQVCKTLVTFVSRPFKAMLKKKEISCLLAQEWWCQIKISDIISNI